MTEHCDEIFTVFHDYIAGHPDFDIVKSEKYGYVKVFFYGDDPGRAVKCSSSKDLFNEILWEIANDVRALQLDGPHMTRNLSYKEALEICNRVNNMVERNIPEKRQLYMNSLEAFIREYQLPNFLGE